MTLGYTVADIHNTCRGGGKAPHGAIFSFAGCVVGHHFPIISGIAFQHGAYPRGYITQILHQRRVRVCTQIYLIACGTAATGTPFHACVLVHIALVYSGSHQNSRAGRRGALKAGSPHTQVGTGILFAAGGFIRRGIATRPIAMNVCNAGMVHSRAVGGAVSVATIIALHQYQYAIAIIPVEGILEGESFPFTFASAKMHIIINQGGPSNEVFPGIDGDVLFKERLQINLRRHGDGGYFIRKPAQHVDAFIAHAQFTCSIYSSTKFIAGICTQWEAVFRGAVANGKHTAIAGDGGKFPDGGILRCTVGIARHYLPIILGTRLQCAGVVSSGALILDKSGGICGAKIHIKGGGITATGFPFQCAI